MNKKHGEEMGMLKKFKYFVFRGNVVDMAVGVMVGGAFSKIVTSLVNDLFMPLISLLTGKIDFSNLFIALDGSKFATLAEANEAGASVLAYGSFIQTVVDFLIMAICVFAFISIMQKIREKMTKKTEEPVAKEPRLCPYCKSEIHDDATRCPHCTSQLD